MAQVDLHTHTTFSDGRFTAEEIVLKAIEKQLSHVAVTDHYQTSKVRSIPPDGVCDYIRHVKELAEKHAGKIKVLVGLEIDTSPSRTDFNRLPLDCFKELDFVLFEYVQDMKSDGIPLWEAVKIAREFPCPVGLAHNDIGKNFSHQRMGDVVTLLKSNGLFVELSTSKRYRKFGKPPYHYAESFFKKFSEEGVLVSVGSDTHQRLDDVGEVGDAYQFLGKHKLLENIVTNAWK